MDKPMHDFMFRAVPLAWYLFTDHSSVTDWWLGIQGDHGPVHDAECFMTSQSSTKWSVPNDRNKIDYDNWRIPRCMERRFPNGFMRIIRRFDRRKRTA